MGAMTNVVIGPTPSDAVTLGQSISPLRTIAGINNLCVPFSAKMSASYLAGGDTIALPATEVAGYAIACIVLATTKVGARRYNWNGSISAPKIMSYTAFDTEVADAVDLSAVTMTGLLFLVG